MTSYDPERRNRALLVFTLMCCMGTSVHHALPLVWGAVSPDAPALQGREVRSLAFWLCMWGSTCGMVFAWDWARKLLRVLLVLVGLQHALIGLLVGGPRDALGAVVLVAWVLGPLAGVHALGWAARYTGGPAETPTWRQLGGVVVGSAAMTAASLLVAPWTGSVQRLEDLPPSGSRELAPLAAHERWEGDTLRVVGVRDGLPQSEPVLEWALRVVPRGEDRIEIRGLHFAGEETVEVDLARNALRIGGEVFEGRVLSGSSPLFGNTPFEGVTFTRGRGRVYGKASILILADGRVALDFDKVFVNGRRAQEYGAVAPVDSGGR